jgi:hypothetical protein
MTPEQFIAKYQATTLKERSAAQTHFNDLCAMLGVEAPGDADPDGEWYCFERGAKKSAGGSGWADVWKRGCFGWEYKGKGKDLDAAYAQLQQYAVALENPPLLVVCDLESFRIHTNWTNTVSVVHQIALEELTDASVRRKLRDVFTEPERLKPKKTRRPCANAASSPRWWRISSTAWSSACSPRMSTCCRTTSSPARCAIASRRPAISRTSAPSSLPPWRRETAASAPSGSSGSTAICSTTTRCWR